MATVKLKGNEVKLSGNEINVGDKAPEATVVATDLSEKKVGGAQEKVQMIVVVPSLDTPVCATETRKFNESAANIEGVDVTVVSMDLPFASKRFCSTEGVENLTVASDFRNKEFGEKYGVLIEEGPLAGILARAIFIIGKDGTVVYKQLVPEITEEPNYDEAIEAAKAAANK
ncbi:thiol peroxidase [Nitrosophilus alvini]|uniref:thiol peroxidase n=1 Tax=Nitrosophilus alvini TaxID=2714855 RepID=UPI00190DBC01|nr:thiol peroxidase [Nitrosophilus alvini]